jgi:hypothetical protein
LNYKIDNKVVNKEEPVAISILMGAAISERDIEGTVRKINDL